MALTPYTYSITADVDAQKVDVGSLHVEISQSPILVSLDGVNTRGDTLTVVFKAPLSTESPDDKAALDDLVRNHSGVPMTDPLSEDGVPLVKLGSPREDDGKPVVVVSPAPEGLMTYFTGRGDDLTAVPPNSGRGMGPQIRIDFSPGESYPQTKTTQWKYKEPTWTHDGQLTWNPPAEFSADDHFSLSVVIPATVATPADPAGTGNVNLIPTGLGYNVIVPAADSNGTHNVDLNTAAPVPTTRRISDGFWDVDYYSGLVVPSANPGTTWWHLLDVQVQSYFIRCIPINNPMGVYDVDVYKTDWVPQNYQWELEVHKETAPSQDCTLAGWLLMFREYST